MNRIVKNSCLVFVPSTDFSEAELSGSLKQIKAAGKSAFFVSEGTDYCSGDRGTRIKTDLQLVNARSTSFSSIWLIGGSGIAKISFPALLKNILFSFHAENKPIGAICLAPLFLLKAGLLSNIRATVHPNGEQELINAGVKFVDKEVVSDKGIITASGPAAVQAWAETILKNINVM